MDFSFSSSVAIVTGSSRGLGLASARCLVEEGCRVTLCARGEAHLSEAAKELQRVAASRDHVLPIVADVSSPDGVARIVLRTVETFGGLDILVNNVGLGRGSGIVDTTDADWHEAIDQTLFPAIRTSRLAVPHMRRRGGGSIVMIASIWGRESGGRMTYNAVKAAEISLAKSMAQQLARDNIRVNSVAPGSILFPGGSWHRRQQEDPAGIADFVLRELPFGRFGRADEVGAVVAFLASPRASWISGATIPSMAANPGHLFRSRPPSPLDRPPGDWYYRRFMNDTALATRSSRDTALDAALDRLAPGDLPDRPDSPDLHVTAVRRLQAQEARYAPFPEGLDERLRSALQKRGVQQLYTHQAEAIDHALNGRHVVVTTPTASGKTLCYNAPILHSILQDPSSRALYLFPTKALAQDQLAELHAMCETLDAASGEKIGVFTYDGDTPQDARRSIRSRAHLVLSNPDMVHSGILPHHPRWAKLFENLRYVVIDELHTYRGVFGSHLCNVLRRLRRICRHYGSSPVFLCSSATIANPRELAERLTEQSFEVIDKSGSPRGEKCFVFVNPPVVNHQLGIRRSYLGETRRIAAEFLKRKLQLIVFAQSRLSTEILTTYLKDDFEGAPGGPERIRGYRGGYLPLRRREIEKGLREGSVRAVVSTNALELGIDIGALDVSVMAGYPGTIASTWQRAGRAGRRAGRSAAVMVASSAPLDQFVVRNPSYFFDASPERALIDPDNLHILVDHVKCAAFELPFTRQEQFGRHDVQEVLMLLAEQGLVHASQVSHDPDQPADGTWTWTSESYPADAVSLRSVSSDNFVIVDTTREPCVIGETDFTSGPATLHPKAIYIVEGRLYQVEKLDFEGRKAYVREIDCDYYTTAISYARVTVIDTFAEGAQVPPLSPVAGPSGTGGDGRNVGIDLARPVDSWRSHGEVHVVSRVVGFKKIKFYTNENIGSGELDLPEQQMHTTSYWMTIPRGIMAILPYAPDDRRDGVVGMAFAMKQIAQLLLMCDGHDIGISIDTEAQTPRLFVYDNYPGGIGFSEPLYRLHCELLVATRRLIAECECETGCPGCVGPVGHAGPLAKSAALRILDLLLAEELAA